MAGNTRLGAGAPPPTRPGGEAEACDERWNPGVTVPAPRGVAQETRNCTGERLKEQVEVEMDPVPGQRAWLHAALPPWLDTQYQDTMRDHRVANP